MVLVTVEDGDRSQVFKVETAAGLIPIARDVFGEGFILDPNGVALTAEYGDLEDKGVYKWSYRGEKPHRDPNLCWSIP